PRTLPLAISNTPIMSIMLLVICCVIIISVEGMTADFARNNSLTWTTPQGGATRSGAGPMPMTMYGPLYTSWSRSTSVNAFNTMVIGSVEGSTKLVALTDVALSVWDVESGSLDYQYTVYRWLGSHQLQGIALWPTLAGKGDTLVASVSNSGADVLYLRVNVAAWELKTGQPIWFFTPKAPVAGTSISGISCVAAVASSAAPPPPVWCLGGLFVNQRSYINTTLYELDASSGKVLAETLLFQRSNGFYLDTSEGASPTLSADGSMLYVAYGEYSVITTGSTRVAAYDLAGGVPALKWSVSTGLMDDQIPALAIVVVSPTRLAVGLQSGKSSPNPSSVVILDAETGATIGEEEVEDALAYVVGKGNMVYAGGAFDTVVAIDLRNSGMKTSRIILPSASATTSAILGSNGALVFQLVHLDASCYFYYLDADSGTPVAWSSTECDGTGLAATDHLLFRGNNFEVTADCLVEPCPRIAPPPPPAPWTPDYYPPPSPWFPWHTVAIMGAAVVIALAIGAIFVIRSRYRRRMSYGPLLEQPGYVSGQGPVIGSGYVGPAPAPESGLTPPSYSTNYGGVAPVAGGVVAAGEAPPAYTPTTTGTV
ncbi:uncharacterized protein AMSG_04545, partial [Thecamonas trahens ATCC 50062]